MPTYTLDGRTYLPVCRVPRSELTPGAVYADPATGEVSVYERPTPRGEGCEPFVRRILAQQAHREVILLEPAAAE